MVISQEDILSVKKTVYRYILEEYCISRRDILVGDFINALTRGGPSGKPAPIETRSHDPQIYITDMLVWLNKSIPVEKNNINMLVSRCSQTEGKFILPSCKFNMSEKF